MQLSKSLFFKAPTKSRTPKPNFKAFASALAVFILGTSVSQAEVVELSPNELNSAYIKDSTIYIPKATREKVAQKVVNLKIRPGEPSPEQVDREEELKEGAARTAISSLATNQAWDSTRIESSLTTANQPNIQTQDVILPPREIIGAPDGFVLENNFEYTVQDLINMGFTNPQTGEALLPVSNTGQSLNGLAISYDGNGGNLVIPVPGDYQSRVPPEGINSEVLNINQALQNAINIRLQLPKSQ